MKGLRHSTLAFVLLAVVAAGQCLLLTTLVLEQRSGAHFIDVGGIARMQSQRIAYLAATAHGGNPEQHWRDEIETSIAAIRAERREAAEVPSAPNVFSSSEDAVRADALERYLSAARRIERDPARHNVLRDDPHPGPGGPQTAGSRREATRARRVSRRDEQLITAVVAGLALQLTTMFAVWFGLIVPSERRLRASLEGVVAEHAEMQSLFDGNPDAIAVYDLSAILNRTNASRCRLMGRAPAEMIGRHFSTFIEPSRWNEAAAAFARAKEGKYLISEMQLRSPGGLTIDVQLSLFPHVVGGVTRGVIAASRDIREIKAGQAQSEAIAGRLAALCAIASAHAADWRKQVKRHTHSGGRAARLRARYRR